VARHRPQVSIQAHLLDNLQRLAAVEPPVLAQRLDDPDDRQGDLGRLARRFLFVLQEGDGIEEDDIGLPVGDGLAPSVRPYPVRTGEMSLT